MTLQHQSTVNLYGSGNADGRGPLFLKDKTDTWTQITDFPDPGGSTEFTRTVNGFRGIRWGNGNGTNNPGVYANLQAVTVDDKMLVDNGISGDPGAGSLLTFNTSNPDLQYFQVGDVVQEGFQQLEWSSYVIGTVYGGSYAKENGFDGDLLTRTGGDLTFTPPNPIPCQKVRVYLSVASAPLNTVFLNGVDVSSEITSLEQEFIPSGEQFISWKCDPQPAGEPGWWKMIELYIDGEWIALIDASVGGPGDIPSSITVIDTTANTMTVSGGAWTGSDGSGDGTWNQSQVWSTAGAGGSERPAVNAFDGNLSTSVGGSSGFTLTFTGLTTTTSLRIYAGGNPDTMTATINSSPVNVPLTGAGDGWVSVPISGNRYS